MLKNMLDTQKELLRLTTAGSVDDGKSTMIGRLLYDAGAVFEDQLAKIKELSEGEDLDFSLLLDGLSAEREQGITIDVAYRYFSSEKRKFIIADTPGHEQYTRNMVTGASNANLAIILADARKGLLIQSKRHLFIASLLSIPHVLVAINKMDLVDYQEEVFEKIRQDFMDFAAKLNISDVSFVPISALKGEMIVDRGEKMPWYQGPTVKSYLENIQIASDRNLIDFRLPVQYVLRPHQDLRGYAGKIEGGVLRVGDEVMALPSGQTSKVKEIYCDEQTVEYAFNPQSVIVTLEDELDVSRGEMLVRKGNLPKVSTELEAMLSWFHEQPMKKNKRYLIKHTTQTQPVYIEDLRYRVDVNDLRKTQADHLTLNEIGRVKIRSTQPLFFDVYQKNRGTGSFILIDEETNETVAAGMIVSKGSKTDVKSNTETLIQKKGAVLWFTGLSGSGKSTIAKALEKRLADRAIKLERLDGDILREHLCKDLDFSESGRKANIERAGYLAGLLSKHGVLVLASFITPYAEQREVLRDEVSNFVEIYVNTPLAVCEERDVKGLYKKARAGEIENFTGIGDRYDAPVNPDLEIVTEDCSVEEAVEEIVEYLVGEGYLERF